MGYTRQKIYKEIDVIWIQLHMMVKEAADQASRTTDIEHTVAKLQRIAHKLGGGVVATNALALKPCLIVRLRKQHIIYRIDLITCEVMVVQKPTEIVDVVRPLQLAIRNDEKLTGEIAGMPMTGRTTVVPQPVQVYIGSPDHRHRQHRRNQYDTYSQINSHSVYAWPKGGNVIHTLAYIVLLTNQISVTGNHRPEAII